MRRRPRDPLDDLYPLLDANWAWLRANGVGGERGSLLMGDTPIELMAYGRAPDAARAERLAALINGNREHPARELMGRAGDDARRAVPPRAHRRGALGRAVPR